MADFLFWFLLGAMLIGLPVAGWADHFHKNGFTIYKRREK